MKKCARCNIVKPISEFHKGSCKDGLHSMCKECNCKNIREWKKKNPDKAKATNARWYKRNKDVVKSAAAIWHKVNKPKRPAQRIKRKYGLTMDEYMGILASQNGGCGICGTTTPMGGRGLFCVDHDHETGALRGILCGKCNTAIGMLRDNVELVSNALEYLKKYQTT